LALPGLLFALEDTPMKKPTELVGEQAPPAETFGHEARPAAPALIAVSPRLLLPWPCIRRVAVRPAGCIRGYLTADRQRGGGVRGLAPAVAAVAAVDRRAALGPVSLGVVLAAMNMTFCLANARLTLATVGSVEFPGVIVLAAAGVRRLCKMLALGLAVAGVLTLTDIRLAGKPVGFGFAIANCALFMLYLTLGHRVANTRSRDESHYSGIDQLGAAMLIAAVVTTPLGLVGAAPAFTHPGRLMAGVAVGIRSSVVPYVTDQLAMARLRRATFALILSVLPACATVIGLFVLAQLPTVSDLLGAALVIAAVAVHQQPTPRPDREERRCGTSV
jgi:inner membrane transporter RhtA